MNAVRSNKLRAAFDTAAITEFTNSLAILDHAFRALRSDGRLVVLDRGPRPYHGESREIQMQQYQIAASVAEDEIRERGFEILSRNNRFIDRPTVERRATGRMITFGG
jgi:hypothetical protein